MTRPRDVQTGNSRPRVSSSLAVTFPGVSGHPLPNGTMFRASLPAMAWRMGQVWEHSAVT